MNDKLGITIVLVENSAHAEVADSDFLRGIKINAAMDARQSPLVLVFKIGTVGVFQDFEGQVLGDRCWVLVVTFQEGRYAELGWFHSSLAVAHTLTVYPYVEGAADGTEMDIDLLVLPFGWNSKRTTIDTRGITFHIGSIRLLWRGHHVRRINLERVAAAAIDRRTIAVHFPVGRYGEGFPQTVVEVGLPEAVGLLIGRLRPIELPFTVEGNFTRMMEIGTGRFAVDLENTLVFPIVGI